MALVKIRQVFYLLMPIILFFLFSAKSVNAATLDAQVTLSVHKILFQAGSVPSSIQNDGTNVDSRSLKDYRGLNGVTFSIYDVSKQFYDYQKQGLNQAKARSKASHLTPKQALTTQVTQTKAGEAGIADFTVSEYVNSGSYRGQYAVYLILETQSPDIVKEKAAPLLVTLPIEQSNKELTSINLYPKNEEIAYQTPNVEKKVLNKKDSYSYGETIAYQITTTVPVDAWNYQKYQINDTADPELLLDSRSLTVKLNGEKLTDYQLETNSNHFVLKLNPKDFTEFAGQKLVITYQMKINALKSVKNILNNTATVVPGNHPQIKKSTKINTGNQRFIKVDLINHSKGLVGAQFVIQNDKGEYLSRINHKNDWLTLDGAIQNQIRQRQLFVLSADQTGAFNITGLNFGKYHLVEVKAPSGYIRSTKRIDFSIDKKTSAANNLLKVINKKSSYLPQTNDQQQIIFIIIGIIIICLEILSFIAQKRRGEKR